MIAQPNVRQRADPVLAKCANPVCNAKFKYLHAGKLLAIEYRCYRQHDRSDSNRELMQSFDRQRCFWLCHACSQVMTILASREGGIRLATARQDFNFPRSPITPHIQEFKSIASSAPRMMTAENALKALERELEFLENGGYRSGMGWRAPFFFEDSPICPKPAFSICPVGCPRVNFIPDACSSEDIPCRHISLNEAGESLHTLYNTATNEEIEQTLREWLRKTIAEFKRAARSDSTFLNEESR